jgi:hypothetical protein
MIYTMVNDLNLEDYTENSYEKIDQKVKKFFELTE